MEISIVAVVRAAASFACLLCFAMPCAASPFAADVNDPAAHTSDFVAAAESVAASAVDLSIASSTPSEAEVLPSAPLPSDVLPASASVEARDDRPPGHSVLRADSLTGMLEPLLDAGLLGSAPGTAYPTLPGTATTPAVLAGVPALRTPVRGESAESTWRETGFNVMRWTSAALAVLAVAGTVFVLMMPGLRRRLFFPDLPQMPPRPA